MKRKTALSTIAGSLLAATVLLPSTGALGADALPTKTAAIVQDPGWYFFGAVEAGGRLFLNDPNQHGIASQGQKSLGKYYEYSDIRPGPFLNGWLDWGTKDGLWDYNVWADNVGYDDQRYQAKVSKAGEFYLTFEWDQTPHIYSTNALTMYQGLGSNHLTLPAGLSNSLFVAAGCFRAVGLPPTGCTSGNPAAAATNATQTPQEAAIQNIINNNAYMTDIGIRRDTASVSMRWTPNDSWDVNVDYSNMHRHGSQVEGVVFSPGTSGVVAQVPKPVDDTTQNFGINGEYKGTSAWGQLFTLKVGYAGSVYRDEWNSYTVDNPFCATGSGPGECARGGSPSSPTALMGLWPNNEAHGFSATTGVDLPWQSRYMGTISYSMMRQNDAFLPFTNQPLVYTNAGNTVLGAPPALPASSLNGAINNFLSNNVVTTQITPALKNKFTYRYFDMDNNTPELLFNNWVVTDVKLATVTSNTYAPVHSLSISYTKQNVGDELVWSPDKQWTLGGAYGFERYNWTRADANITNENTGRLFIDYKPWIWLTSRASWNFGARRYDNYDYLGNVGTFQWQGGTAGACLTGVGCNTQYNQAMRQFYLDNRDRNVVRYSLQMDVLRGLTVTPTFIYQDDDYRLNSPEVGLTRSTAVKGGVEVAYAFDPQTTVLFSYMNEQYRQRLRFSTASGLGAVTSGSTWHSDIIDNVNTFTGAVNWTPIPEKLDLRLAYTLSMSKDHQPINSDTGATPTPGNVTPGTGGQFPDVRGQWSRLEATAKYTFDREVVRSWGINGQAYAKLRYVWERNSVDNFDQDIMAAYMSPLINNTGFMTWMAYNNPNYNVHLLGASVGLRW